MKGRLCYVYDTIADVITDSVFRGRGIIRGIVGIYCAEKIIRAEILLK
jgi:hypothetical protein